MVKACIFDLDGTLLDTLTSIAYAGNDALRREGLCTLPRDNFRYYAGDGAAELVRRFLRDTKRDESADEGQLSAGALSHDPAAEADFAYYFDSYMQSFSAYCTYEVKPFPQIRELLDALKARGVRIAVLSNKPDAQTKEVVRGQFGADYFDYVSGQRPEIPRKPSPEGALLIAERFSAAPEECLYLGDTGTDMQTGSAAGMRTIGVTWGFRDEAELVENGADRVISEPLALLEELGGRRQQ